VVVLTLPRGGVPVASEVARARRAARRLPRAQARRPRPRGARVRRDRNRRHARPEQAARGVAADPGRVDRSDRRQGAPRARAPRARATGWRAGTSATSTWPRRSTSSSTSSARRRSSPSPPTCTGFASSGRSAWSTARRPSASRTTSTPGSRDSSTPSSTSTSPSRSSRSSAQASGGSYPRSSCHTRGDVERCWISPTYREPASRIVIAPLDDLFGPDGGTAEADPYFERAFRRHPLMRRHWETDDDTLSAWPRSRKEAVRMTAIVDEVLRAGP
jgi:hypothetical protein